MEYCIADAREKGKSGVCMLGSKKHELPWELIGRIVRFRVEENQNGD